MLQDYVKAILNSKVYDVAKETPLTHAKHLSATLHNQIWIKREDLQSVFSFKLRGAYNKMAHLTDAQKAKGAVTASAGNHAQGVALAAQKLGISAKIVMPATTPEIKVSSVKSRGGDVILFGDSFDLALGEALRLEKEEGRTFIAPYDDFEVIAGQGTIAMEILRQIHHGKIDAIFVPVGGGGLIAGIAAYVKYVRPDIKIIGVESEESACMTRALEARSRTRLSRVGIFADGVAVAQPGKLPFEIALKCIDEMVTVSNDEICAAVHDVFLETRTLSEPSGALSTAGIKKYIALHHCENQTFVSILSGANVDFKRLRFIAERAEIGQKKEGLFRVETPDRPGAFCTFVEALKSVSVTELNYRYADPARAEVFLGVNLKNGLEERAQIKAHLSQLGFATDDYSDDELMKDHIRYMIGGKLPDVAQNEIVFQLEFPERSGALLHFLKQLNGRWNISLFHYRDRGGISGLVLVALQAEANELPYVEAFFRELGYPFENVSSHEGYRHFLR